MSFDSLLHLILRSRRTVFSFKELILFSDNFKITNPRRQISYYVKKGYLYHVRRGLYAKDRHYDRMAAHKLVAMYERLSRTRRDVYDVWFFCKHRWPVNKKIVEHRTGMSYMLFLKICIELLENLTDNSMLSGLGVLLSPHAYT